MNQPARDLATPDRAPHGLVRDWAARIAARFEAADPAAALARVGITLRVAPTPLCAARTLVYGAWDPHLRRVEVFGARADRSDAELVTTLGHELWHMMEDLRQRARGRAAGAPRDEDAARAFSAAWVACLPGAAVRRCAAALRALADAGRAEAERTVGSVLSIGE